MLWGGIANTKTISNTYFLRAEPEAFVRDGCLRGGGEPEAPMNPRSRLMLCFWFSSLSGENEAHRSSNPSNASHGDLCQRMGLRKLDDGTACRPQRGSAGGGTKKPACHPSAPRTILRFRTDTMLPNPVTTYPRCRHTGP